MYGHQIKPPVYCAVHGLCLVCWLLADNEYKQNTLMHTEDGELRAGQSPRSIVSHGGSSRGKVYEVTTQNYQTDYHRPLHSQRTLATFIYNATNYSSGFTHSSLTKISYYYTNLTSFLFDVWLLSPHVCDTCNGHVSMNIAASVIMITWFRLDMS